MVMAAVGVGDIVRAGRERAGLSVRDVSDATKIRAALLEAIEHDEFRACLGDFYARGHLRAIARVTDLDAAALVDQFNLLHAEDRPPVGEPATATSAVLSPTSRASSAASTASGRLTAGPALAWRRLLRPIRPGV
jgi:transcriptional regulator with XRE-family HTH domain